MKKVGPKILLGLPKDLLKYIDREAKRQGLNRTRFIRRILIRYLDEIEAKRGAQGVDGGISPTWKNRLSQT